MTISINKKLLDIQQNLKVEKKQFNSFGKYKYRSCGDILEALKPLLSEKKAALTLTDEIIMIGDRYYVKAIATLQDLESDANVQVSSLAREDKERSGMAQSQVTGSTSSYARKYALNGLFCIDDTKDEDATNKHENDSKQTNYKRKAKSIDGSTIAPVKNDSKLEEKKKDKVDFDFGENKKDLYINDMKKCKNIDELATVFKMVMTKSTELREAGVLDDLIFAKDEKKMELTNE